MVAQWSLLSGQSTGSSSHGLWIRFLTSTSFPLFSPHTIEVHSNEVVGNTTVLLFSDSCCSLS